MRQRSRSRAGKSALAVFVASALVFVGATAAEAIYYAGGMPSATYRIKPWSYNSTWQTPMDNALSSWNSASSKVNITKNSAATAYVTAAQYSATWYGVYSPSGIPSLRTFHIQLNSRTISADASNITNFIRSVFAHELGHSLSQNDDPPISGASLMKQSRNRNTLFNPQAYDVSFVNSFY